MYSVKPIYVLHRTNRTHCFNILVTFEPPLLEAFTLAKTVSEIQYFMVVNFGVGMHFCPPQFYKEGPSIHLLQGQKAQ